MKNFPLYCPKCKQETLIDVKGMKVVDCKKMRSDFAMRLASLSKMLYNDTIIHGNDMATKNRIAYALPIIQIM